MKKRLLLLALLGIGLFFLALSRYPIRSRALGDLIERQGKKIEGVETTLGEVRLYLFPLRLEVRDVKVLSGDTVLEAGRVLVTPKLFPLLHRELVLKRLEVEDFEIETSPLGGRHGLAPPPFEELALKRGRAVFLVGSERLEFSVTHGDISLKRGRGKILVEGVRPKGRLVLTIKREGDVLLTEGKGGGVDLEEVRAILDGLGKGGVLRGIKGGRVSAFRFRYPFRLEGKGDYRLLHMEGDFQGVIFDLPQGGTLQGGYGGFLLSSGLLTIKGGGAKLGETILEDVTLKGPLLGEGGSWTFEARVRTTPEDLLFYLPRFLKGRQLEGILKDFEGSRGQIEGTLTIEGDKVEAKVEGFQLILIHQRLPFPIEMVGKATLNPSLMSFHLGRVFSKAGSLLEVDLDIPLKGGKGRLRAGGGKVDLMALQDLLSLPLKVKGTLDLKELQGSFVPKPLKVLDLFLRGIPDLWVEKEGLPPLRIVKGELTYRDREIGLKEVGVRTRGLEGVLSGVVDLKGRGVSLRGNVTIGDDFPEEYRPFLPVPPFLWPRTPFTFQGQAEIQGERWALQGKFSFEDAVHLEIEAEGGEGRMKVKTLRIVGREGTAVVVLTNPPLVFHFRGKVAQGVLERVWGVKGVLKGDFSVDLALKAFNGWLEAEDPPFSLVTSLPLRIERLVLKGEGQGFQLSGNGSFLDCPLKGEGRGRWEEGLSLDLTVRGGNLDLLKLSTLPRGEGKKLKGRIAFRLESARYKDFILKNPWGKVRLGDRIEVRVEGGTFCGIEVEGSFGLEGNRKEVDVKFSAAEAPLGGILKCLGVKEGLADGQVLLEGTFQATGEGNLLKTGSRGSLYLYSRQGRIYKLTALSRLLSLINVTEILRGKFPDFTGKGFPYDRLEVTGTMANGILHIEEGVVEGQSLKIFMQGDIHLPTGYLDLRVLVAPFRTVDALLSKIPLVGPVLTGKSQTFISFPFRVKGDYRNPEVIPLPPEEVGKGLLGIVERTLKLPLQIINPFLP